MPPSAPPPRGGLRALVPLVYVETAQQSGPLSPSACLVSQHIQMKILQWKMKILPLKNDDFGATRCRAGGVCVGGNTGADERRSDVLLGGCGGGYMYRFRGGVCVPGGGDRAPHVAASAAGDLRPVLPNIRTRALHAE